MSSESRYSSHKFTAQSCAFRLIRTIRWLSAVAYQLLRWCMPRGHLFSAGPLQKRLLVQFLVHYVKDSVHRQVLLDIVKVCRTSQEAAETTFSNLLELYGPRKLHRILQKAERRRACIRRQHWNAVDSDLE